jgi:pyruvate carboxylase subunit B
MKYYVEIEGRTYEIEIGADWHLVLDGRSHTLRAHRADGRGEWQIEIDGRRHHVLALDERNRAIRNLTGGRAVAEGPAALKAPMPGLVIAVEVVTDELVECGQGLVVIEAMKMENELKATTSGRVTEVHVTAGQAVDKGETLLVLDAGRGEA